MDEINVKSLILRVLLRDAGTGVHCGGQGRL